MNRLACLIGFAVLALSSVAADTIVSRTGPVSGGAALLVNQTIMTSWTQSSAYSDVSISATLGWPEGSPTPPPVLAGTAYLMNQVGPGASGANEIASAPFTTALGFTDTNLFLGLNLGGGTYYLVLSSNDGPFWANSVGPLTTLSTAPGVQFNGNYISFDEDAYPPSEMFSSDPRDFLFSVSGSAVVPESSTRFAPFLAALTVLALRIKPCLRRRARRM